MSDSIFGDVIFAYTRQDAINDGNFVEQNDMAKRAGFKFDVCVSANLYHSHIYTKTDKGLLDKEATDRKMMNTLTCLRTAISQMKGKDNMIFFKVPYMNVITDVWAVCEPKSQTDPTPAINIFLPEDN